MAAAQMVMLGLGVSALDIQTVTTGASGTAGAQDRIRGYSTVSGVGSIVDGTSDIYGGAAITELHWFENFGSPYYALTISGATNSGWETLRIGGTDLSRASASFSSGAWTWNAPGSTVGSQAFGSGGTVVPVLFLP